MATELVEARRVAKTLARVSRQATRALAQLEAAQSIDLFARLVVEADAEPSEQTVAELSELLRLARRDYPGQELHLLITAHVA